MPVLPSGRRIDFSLDRFHALLGRMDLAEAQRTVAALHSPDDLLYVMDVVQYHADSGKAFFSGQVVADFESYVLDWSIADQDALAAWIESPDARFHRAEAIDNIRDLMAELVEQHAEAKPKARFLQAA